MINQLSKAFELFKSLNLRGSYRKHVHALHFQRRGEQDGDTALFAIVISSYGYRSRKLRRYRGTDQVTIEKSRFMNRDCLAQTRERVAKGKKGTIQSTTIDYFYRDDSGDYRYLGNNQGPDQTDQALVEPGCFTFTEFRVGARHHEVDDYENGTTVTRTSTIDKPEQVSVPAGKFMTWRVTFTQINAKGIQFEGIQWIAPQIGTVKSRLRYRLPGDGFHLDVQQEQVLVSTNIPLD